jgi:NTP pyrophosphatase (non-canonical NTP hydrolase)
MGGAMRDAIQRRILDEIFVERCRQDEIWGDAKERGLTPEYWLAIVAEEFGECARAILEKKPGDLRKELIQTAAAVAAMIEAME